MPAGRKYAFFIHVLAGSLIKIGICRKLTQQFDTVGVYHILFVISSFDNKSARKSWQFLSLS